MRIGIDAGGTFTDFIVLHDDGRLESFKLRSNPRNPASVILEGLRRAAGSRRAEVIHGSTVATNALLERKGARTALVTTAGFEDVIQIGRQYRPRLYDLNPPPKRALLSQADCFGAAERTFFDGTVEQPLSLGDLPARLRDYQSVAICFLHSYANPANEQAALQHLQASGAYVCASHQVCPEFREYERTSTTVLNAYVGPLMDHYLAELERESRSSIQIMQSNGGLMSATQARASAVRTLLSGPAGGVVGAVETARASGFTKVLGFDMGGTSTDVSLSEGRPVQSMEASIDGFPVRVPMLDIHTVGAGGGSIARVDEGGLLRVGPESAGADPGPACYGSGEQPTVTDAHVVLGRIAAEQLAGGSLPIDEDRARAAVSKIAKTLGSGIEEAAAGILRVANANMERAIRTVSIERGHDAREFALLAFGGCGGLHACEIAEEIGIRTVLVPHYAGVLSALGMLLADHIRDYAAGVLGRSGIEAEYRALEKLARAEMRGALLERSMDVRYTGQSYEINVPTADEFHDAHQQLYGYCDRARATEIVTLRVRATKLVAKPSLAKSRLKEPAARRGAPHNLRTLLVGRRKQRVPVCHREEMPRAGIGGPALVLDYGATTWVAPGWRVRRDRMGMLILTA